MAEPSDYWGTFNTPSGQEVLKDLRHLYYDRPNYSPGESIHNLTFREGQRSVILVILDMMEQARLGIELQETSKDG